MPPCDQISDHRKCEVFSDSLYRKIRLSQHDQQRLLDKLYDRDINLYSGGTCEGDPGTFTKTTWPMLRDAEVAPLSNGEKLYGKPEKQLENLPGVPYAFNKNFTIASSIQCPHETLAKFRAATGIFEINVKDNAHIEDGREMKCSVCKHKLEQHTYVKLKRVFEWQNDVEGASRTNLQNRLSALDKPSVPGGPTADQKKETEDKRARDA